MIFSQMKQLAVGIEAQRELSIHYCFTSSEQVRKPFRYICFAKHIKSN